MEWDGLDYYTLLGIDRSASADEIGRAYRAAARATHPDIHPNEPSSGRRFSAITSAYETLNDPARRAAYDHRARPATPRAYRVEPIKPPKTKTSVVPIPPQRAPRPHPEPQAPVPIQRIPRPTTIEGDAVELAACLSRLLRWTWRSL